MSWMLPEPLLVNDTRSGIDLSIGSEGVIGDIVRRIRALVGRSSSVTFARGRCGDQLRVVWQDGDARDAQPRRALLRRTAFEDRSAIFRPLGKSRTTGVFPLMVDDEVLGVLEVIGASSRLRSVRPTLELLANQLGLLIRSVNDSTELRREVEALEDAPHLGLELARVREPREAVAMVVGFLADRFGVPVAGWCRADVGFELAATKGFRFGAQEHLENEMSAFSSLDADEAGDLRRTFESIASDRVVVHSADDALVLACSSDDLVAWTLSIVGSLLDEVLPRLRQRRLEERPEQLDLGIALAAHELRAPLLGVRAALEVIGSRQRADDTSAAMVRSSVRELDLTLGTTDALLAWAAGGRVPERRLVNLVELVEEAIESCTFASAVPGVTVDAPPTVTIDVAPTHVRTAIANLVRNAMSYRRPGTMVQVRVRDRGDRVFISVHDHGPRILEPERSKVFEPFFRGKIGRQSGLGTGLGLFITRRVVDAHGGSIWVDAEGHGTTFSIEFPRGAR